MKKETIEDLDKKISQLEKELKIAQLELEIRKTQNTRIEEEIVIKRQVINTYPIYQSPVYPNPLYPYCASVTSENKFQDAL